MRCVFLHHYPRVVLSLCAAPLHFALWVSGLAALGEPGHEAWYYRLHPAHSVGRFNGSCATASNLHWLLLPQPGWVGNEG